MACCPDGKSDRPRNGRSRKLTAADIESEILPVVDDPTLAGQLHWTAVKLCGWHKTVSLYWHHIKPVHLAPYSPDFNPIERLWQHLKGQPMAGYLTNDGEALTEKLLESLASLLDKPDLLRSACSPPTFNRK